MKIENKSAAKAGILVTKQRDAEQQKFEAAVGNAKSSQRYGVIWGD